jgi:hypothetical protein
LGALDGALNDGCLVGWLGGGGLGGGDLGVRGDWALAVVVIKVENAAKYSCYYC